MRNQGAIPSVDEHYIRPEKAEALIKTAQTISQTVYIYGTTGSGKTSLVVDFLSRRKYRYYSAADTEPEDLLLIETEGDDLKHTEKQQIVIIDDLHLLDSADSREKYYPALKLLSDRRNIWLILISRSPLPKWLKPLYIHRIFVLIGENELSFTKEEQERYLEKWGLSPTQPAMNRLTELGGAHPLFLRIVAMRLTSAAARETESGSFTDIAERVKSEEASIELARRDFWDYLETYVYDQWNIELQEFLMDISIVEQFDLQMAQQITRKKDAGRLILQAQETGNFVIEREESGSIIYELRIPMRLSMRRRLAQKYSSVHISALYYSAGSGYELKGEIPQALCMYEKCQNEEAISRLLIENARKNAGNGHYLELKKYYFALSEETIKSSPELMAGMSLLQSILLNDEESERWYAALVEYARSNTGSMKKSAEIRLLYLDISLPHKGTVKMVDILKRAGVFLIDRKAALPEVSLTNNQPSLMNGGKDFCEWSRHDRELARSIGKLAEMVLGRGGKGLVNLALAESFFEKGNDNYEVSVLANKGRIQAESGGKLENVFSAVGILAWLSLFNNHAGDAFEMLMGFREKAATDAPQLLPCIDALRIHFLLCVGRSGEVQEWLEQKAPDEDTGFVTLERFRYMVKIRVYLAAGRKEKALRLLQQILYFAERRQRIYLYIEAKLLLAVTQHRMGEQEWRENLQEVITRAESYHFVRIFTREGAAVWELLRTQEFIWQDKDYRKQVMAECEQQASLYPGYLREKAGGNVLLSDKAVKILRMQTEGISAKEIARQLNLTEATVRYYNKETYKKLGVSSKAAAITEARNRKII